MIPMSHHCPIFATQQKHAFTHLCVPNIISVMGLKMQKAHWKTNIPIPNPKNRLQTYLLMNMLSVINYETTKECSFQVVKPVTCLREYTYVHPNTCIFIRNSEFITLELCSQGNLPLSSLKYMESCCIVTSLPSFLPKSNKTMWSMIPNTCHDR